MSLSSEPPRWGLAVACAALPFLLSLGWLVFVRRFDRARPEPLWLVVATFAMGAASVVPAAAAEMGLAAASPWLDPDVVTFGGQAWALPISIVVFALVVGAVEEGAKLGATWLLPRRRPEFDEPIDGVIYGCAAALGFAAIENVKYFALGRMSGALIAMRAFVTLPAHMFFGAIWGYGMGVALVSRKSRLARYFVLAAVAHGAFDALLSTDGMQLVAAVLVLLLGLGFIHILRLALRYGAVPSRPVAMAGGPPATEPLPASMLPRAYFRVGSPATFWICAAAMIFCAFALTVLGSAFEYLHHRVGIVFVSLSTLALSLFGLAAYGASATTPLDVAVDAHGLTFAGVRTPWSSVVDSDVQGDGRRAFARLVTKGGELRIGPTRMETAVEIVAAVRAALP